MSNSGFRRFCSYCGGLIPEGRLLKAVTSKARVFFCSDLCRYADANAKNRKARELRSANPNRNTCLTCHGRGYTRVKCHQHIRYGETTTQSEAVDSNNSRTVGTPTDTSLPAQSPGVIVAALSR
jgi:ribosomal protein L24E